MNAPAPAAAIEQFARIPLTAIVSSKTNPRKNFDKAKLDELAASIKDHGVIQPVLVRQHPDPRHIWELVAGERRLRASVLAGVADIPATIRELTDEQALQIQVIENLQRDDLHPLEEAEGYEVLMKQHKYTADMLAAKIGKSKAYIYARLKLSVLCPEARKAFYEEKLNPSTALLVARIPVHDLQRQATKEITQTRYAGDEPMSVREAMNHLQRNYMLQLSEAPFDRAAADLVPKAGPCTTCPKRTGNQKELFADVKSADVCTDPVCFASKRDAHVVLLTKTAAKKGQEVITGAEAKKIMPHNYGDMKGHAKLDKEAHLNGKYQTYRKALGKDAPPAKLFVNPHTSAIEEIVSDKELAAALKAKGIKEGYSSSGGNDKYRQEQRAKEAKAKREKTWRLNLHQALRPKFAGGLARQDIDMVAKTLVSGLGDEGRKIIARIWVLEPADAKKKRNAWELVSDFQKRIPSLSEGELYTLLMDCAMTGELYVNSYQVHKPEDLLATAARHKVAAEPFRQAAMEEAKAKAPKKTTKTASKKAAPPKPAKKKPVSQFMKPFYPDALLAAVIGDAPQPRIQITSLFWTYIKKHGLQDKQNKRIINCDDKLQALFGKKSVSLFDMTKAITDHLSAKPTPNAKGTP